MLADNTLRKLRRLRYVPRWSIVPTVRQQNVAEHSFHVAWMTAWLYQYIGVPMSVNALLEALVHDADEAVTGDMPTPSKPNSNASRDPARCLLKVADCLEAIMFIHEEHKMGNASLTDIWADVMKRGELWAERLRVAMAESDPEEWPIVGTGERLRFDHIVSYFMKNVNIAIHPGMEQYE